MTTPLTEQEQNFIKDILKAIGGDDILTTQFATCLSQSDEEFNKLADSIFNKLGNGRVTVVCMGTDR